MDSVLPPPTEHSSDKDIAEFVAAVVRLAHDFLSAGDEIDLRAGNFRLLQCAEYESYLDVYPPRNNHVNCIHVDDFRDWIMHQLQQFDAKDIAVVDQLTLRRTYGAFYHYPTYAVRFAIPGPGGESRFMTAYTIHIVLIDLESELPIMKETLVEFESPDAQVDVIIGDVNGLGMRLTTDPDNIDVIHVSFVSSPNMASMLVMPRHFAVELIRDICTLYTRQF